MKVEILRESGPNEEEGREFRSVESIEEGLRDKRLQQVSFALG
jgi:hypothetical protein